MIKLSTKAFLSTNSVSRFSLLLALMLLSLLFMMAGQSYAATYYVSPAGYDTAPGTSSAPWATFAHAMGVLRPGDTLFLEDGIYNQSLDITSSGTSGNTVTFAAVSDGKAIVSTTYPDSALVIENDVAYVEVDGITFRNSGPNIGDSTGSQTHGINIGYADHITLRRIISNGSSGYNSMVISLNGTTNSLLEDCAASGQGRVVLNMLGCSNIVVRRCWLNWTGPDTGGGDTPNVVQVYDSNNVLLENNIGTNFTSYNAQFFASWGHYNSISGNSFYANIGYNTNNTASGIFVDAAECGYTVSGTIFSNNVAILNGSGGVAAEEINADPNNGSVYTNNTFVSPNNTGGGLQTYYRPSCPAQPGAIANASSNVFSDTLTGLNGNSSAVNNTILAHDFNDFYNVYSPLYDAAYISPPNFNSHEIQGDPNYAASTYGYGAYLIAPAVMKGQGQNGSDVGANVIYEYVNGTLTDTPLWPWPIEDRIFSEFNVSPTWESYGGLWTTLDGVYPADIAVPPAPAPPVSNVVFAIYAGGEWYKSRSGIVYKSDLDYSGGAVASTTAVITGTPDPTLYQINRYGNFSYNIPLADGNYTVTLKFAETYWNIAGQRIFNVSMQGTQVISNLDIFALVGENTAYDVSIPVSVTNGILNINFSSIHNYACVSAIEISQSQVSRHIPRIIK